MCIIVERVHSTSLGTTTSIRHDQHCVLVGGGGSRYSQLATQIEPSAFVKSSGSGFREDNYRCSSPAAPSRGRHVVISVTGNGVCDTIRNLM